MKPDLNELYAEVARHADTLGTKIDVADVSRVCASLFSVLVKCPAEEAATLIARGLIVAATKEWS